MTGTLRPDRVELFFTVGKLFTDYSFAGGRPLSVKPTFKFVGTPTPGGAKLVTNGTNVATEGSSIVDQAKAEEKLKSKAKTIIIAVAAGVAGLFAICVATCCYCCFRRKKNDVTYAQPQFVQQGPPPQYFDPNYGPPPG